LLFTSKRKRLGSEIVIPNCSTLLADVVCFVLYQQGVWDGSAMKQEQEDEATLQDYSIWSDG
jgi:hypothetical protein